MEKRELRCYRRVVRFAAVALVAWTGTVHGEELSGFDCLLEPQSVVDVGTREEGVLEEINVERGAVVEQGQVIASLESSVEKIAVELANARTQMSGDIQGKKEAVAYLKRQRARIDELYKKKAVPFHEKDQATTDVMLAEMELRDARETMHLADIEFRRARQALERRTILSPVDGVVVQLLQLRGESVEDRPIMTVADVDPLNV